MSIRLWVLVAGLACAGYAVAQSVPAPVAEPRPPNKSGYAPAFENQTRAPELKANVSYEVKTVASGFDTPFGFEFLPGGNILITERRGQFRIAYPDGTLSPPIKDGLPAVAFTNQGGLLDVLLDRDFARNGIIYWSYSEIHPDETNNTAVARARLVQGPNPRLEDIKIIYQQRPSINFRSHFGARLVFARDGTMFVTQGDRSTMIGRMQAQNLDSLVGKIVRINTDGSVPKDNPFVGRAGARPEIWSIGHRNVQGAFLHPTTGELWTMEHGPQGGDELNVARKGRDFGWPTITYGVEYGPDNTKIGEGPQKAGMEQPVYYWNPVIAPGGMTYYNANLIPAWKGSIFVTGLNTNFVARLTVQGERVKGEERLTFSEGRERYRDISVGPDGALYVLTDGSKARLLRVAPTAGATKRAPAAS